MPDDEGLFRYITDILIPVMDVYDDDPIRKDAVQQENLLVIQQNRPSIRSIYAFLAQAWPPFDNEKVVIPATLKWIFEFALEKLEDPAKEEEKKDPEGGEAKEFDLDYEALLGGEDKLSIELLNCVLDTFDQSIAKVTENHPEPMRERALLFWEFFEVLMKSCQELAAATDVPLHEAIPAYVLTIQAVMGIIDQGGEITLPPPPSLFLDEGME